MANANFIARFEYKLNNLSGTETQIELLSLRATADKYPTVDSAAIALLDAAIDAHADALTNSSTIEELVTVGNAAAGQKSNVKSTQRGISSNETVILFPPVNMEKAKTRILSSIAAYQTSSGTSSVNTIRLSLNLISSTELVVVGTGVSWEVTDEF